MKSSIRTLDYRIIGRGMGGGWGVMMTSGSDMGRWCDLMRMMWLRGLCFFGFRTSGFRFSDFGEGGGGWQRISYSSKMFLRLFALANTYDVFFVQVQGYWLQGLLGVRVNFIYVCHEVILHNVCFSYWNFRHAKVLWTLWATLKATPLKDFPKRMLQNVLKTAVQRRKCTIPTDPCRGLSPSW